MNEIIISAPAKINIGLNIINKRPDGFHNLETVFYPVNLADTIKIFKSDSLKFSTNSSFLLAEEDNIILKAVRLIEKKASIEVKADIFLEKKIPIGAGLGGGSSDAASILKLLNQVYDLNLSEKALIGLALELGSDVPFFIRSTPAFASSRGEILEDIDLNIKNPVLIVNPGIHISTKWAFQNITPGKWERDLHEIIKETTDIKQFRYSISNDFETVCLNHYPELNNIKDKLYSFGADFAIMSGSGSSFFGIFPDSFNAEAAMEYFSELKYFTYLHIDD